VIFRLGFAPTRLAARQLVLQSHIEVNGRKVVSPGYEVRVGEHIAVREGSKQTGALAKRKDFLKQYDAPAWLRLDADKLEGEMLSLPADIEIPFEINLLVESFSK
jgi:small subunit ribosomal protein S4